MKNLKLIQKTEHAIEVMNGFLEGKRIECRESDRKNSAWIQAETPLWNWCQYEYRIAPEPKELYINQYEDSKGVEYFRVFSTADEAVRDGTANSDIVKMAVKYKEIKES